MRGPAADGDSVFQHTCKLRFGGIVTEQRDRPLWKTDGLAWRFALADEAHYG